MPDLMSTRPSSGQPIATAWGDEVHDALEGIQAGSAVLTNANANAASLAIVFPRPYATPPIVVASVAANTTFNYALAHTATTTGVTLMTVRRDGVATSASITVHWIAIGTPA